MPKVVPEYKEEAKQRIMEAALKIFAQRGYDATTMETIGKSLGVSEGAIYAYFDNKRELFKAILEWSRNRFERMASLSYETKEPLEVFLKSVVDMISDSYESLGDLAIVSGLFLEFYAEAARDRQLKKIMRDEFDKDRETIENFLKAIKKGGQLGSNADLHALSLGFIALSHGYVFQLALGIGKDEAKGAFIESAKAIISGTLYRSREATRMGAT